jgi:hypothetical protein
MQMAVLLDTTYGYTACAGLMTHSQRRGCGSWQLKGVERWLALPQVA